MVTITLKFLFLAAALLSAKAARPAEVVKSDVTPSAATLSQSATAMHMATASALLQAHLISKPSQRLDAPGPNAQDSDEWNSDGYTGPDGAVEQKEEDLTPDANKGVARGAMPDGNNDGFESESEPNVARQNGAEDRANSVDGADVDHLDNNDSEAGQSANMDEGSDVSGEEPGAQQIPPRERKEGAIHIPSVISDSMVPSGEEIESKDLFKRTAEESKNLQEAAHGIDSTIHRVDQAIQKVYGATDKYHQSINSLTGQFGKLKDMSTDVHTEVLSEFKDRESDRMCAFENVERMLRGEPFQHCNTASAPANGDYRSNFASSVQQPRDEKLSEEHPSGSPANAAGGAPLEGMHSSPSANVGSEDFAKPHGASPGQGGRDMSM